MQLISIRLKGIRSFKDDTFVLIPNGITGIIGIHDLNPDRSNGIGKTTLATSMLYTFYGDTANLKTLDDIECDQLQKEDDKFAEITFYKSETNSNYRVKRGRKDGASYFEFYENDIPKGGTTIASREIELKRILGMDYDMFTASTFFEQNELNKIVSADSKERRNYIDKILGLSVWRNAGSLITTDFNKVKTSYASIKEEIKSLKDKNNIADIPNLNTSITEAELNIHSLEMEKKNIEQLIENNQKTIQEQSVYIIKQKSITDKTKNRIQLQSDILNIERNIDKLMSDIDSIQITLVSLPEEKKKVEVLIDEFKKKLTGLTELKTECMKKSGELQTHKTIKEKDISILKKSITFFTQNKCDSCEQDIAEDYKTLKIQEKQLEITSIENDLQTIVKDIQTNTIEYSNLAIEYETLSVELKKNIDLLTELDKKLSNSTIILQSANVQLGDKQLELIRLQTLLKTLSDEIAQEEEEIKGIIYINISTYQLEIDKSKKTLANIDSSLKDQNLAIGRFKQSIVQLENVKKEIEEKEKLLKSQELELYYYNILDKAFKGIPTQIFEDTIGYTNREASSIIQKFDPNMEVELYEDKDKKYKPLEVRLSVQKRNRNFIALSEGQKTVVSLALRIGFAKVIAARSNRKIDMIILDEPFGMLDNHNQTQAQSIIADLLEYFKQILVITHIGNISNYPNLITVRMNANQNSYIE